MSIEIDWASITSGPDGAALAESVRAFIHDRFQNIPLPKLIRRVDVHAFDFGSVPPDIEIKDVCDPLPDFYEDDASSSAGDGGDDQDGNGIADTVNPERGGLNTIHERHATATTDHEAQHRPPPARSSSIQVDPLPHGFLGRANSTPGIPGGTSNLNNYFHLPLSAGLSASAMPFAAVAGAQGWPAAESNYFAGWTPMEGRPGPYPPHGYDQYQRRSEELPARSASLRDGEGRPETSPNDVQIVARLRYSGDIRLSLTADINLDYPMQSFVAIPLQLNVTGLTFDGVAIVAYIKRKAHFCFLAPEDADALVGGGDGTDVPDSPAVPRKAAADDADRVGGLFEEIKVESEIGQRDQGRQSLKNVGKVEKFVLEQVRRIFETEFVYPSFWTFLV